MAAIQEAMHHHEQPAPPLACAGISLRIVAFILDCIVVASLAMLFFAIGGAYVLLFAENSDYALLIMLLPAAGAFFPFAPLLFTLMIWWRGQSPGKAAVRIVVSDREGYIPSFGRSLLRTLVWPLSFLPLGIGLASVFFDREHRALHDMLAGTTVRELP